jgi:hypothetical protein
MMVQVKEMRDCLLTYVGEFGEILFNSRLQSRPRAMVSNFELPTSEDDGKYSYKY